MPLLRTGSARSTLSMMQRSATRYEKYIALAAVLLIITSTIVIFTSVVLIKWYFMPNLGFWSINFKVAPYLMLALGIYKFLISLYGFGITSSENRGLLAFFAVLLAIAFIAQVASIFVFWEVRTQLALDSIGASKSTEELNRYGQPGNESTTNAWDTMQRHLHCCGTNGHKNGYSSYQNTIFGANGNNVPDSCCVNPQPGCGKGILGQGSDEARRDKIYVSGCLDLLKQWMKDDVGPMIVTYAIIGIVIALLELIAVVLVSAYVAQISRRREREEMMWSAVRGDNGGGGNEMTPMNTIDGRTSINDTQV